MASAKVAIQIFVRRIFAIFAKLCVVFARNCKFTNLILYNMQFMPCNGAPLPQKTLFLTKKTTLFPPKFSTKCVHCNKSYVATACACPDCDYHQHYQQNCPDCVDQSALSTKISTKISIVNRRHSNQNKRVLFFLDKKMVVQNVCTISIDMNTF